MDYLKVPSRHLSEIMKKILETLNRYARKPGQNSNSINTERLDYVRFEPLTSMIMRSLSSDEILSRKPMLTNDLFS
jgi:hypothetical protein